MTFFSFLRFSAVTSSRSNQRTLASDRSDPSGKSLVPATVETRDGPKTHRARKHPTPTGPRHRVAPVSLNIQATVMGTIAYLPLFSPSGERVRTLALPLPGVPDPTRPDSFTPTGQRIADAVRVSTCVCVLQYHLRVGTYNNN